MKKILITGASGFIGSFLVEEAVKRNWQTWAGIRKNSNREYLSDNNIKFLDLNYSNKESLKEQLNEHILKYGKWDYIIHNAGLTKCLNNEDFQKVNYQYTINLIDALKETGNVPEKFILMSSLSVFGPYNEDSYLPVLLTDKPNPNTAYGKSKLMAETYLQRISDFPYIILRPTGVYGPREKDYFLMIKTIQAGFDFSVGFNPQLLTFIYVKDLVKVAFLALDNPVYNKAYFISDGETYSDKTYTGIVKNVLGKRYVIRIKLPLFILKLISILGENLSKISKKPSTFNRDKYKIMKQRNWSCDISQLEKDLKFTADYKLERGIKECVDWYKANNWL